MTLEMSALMGPDVKERDVFALTGDAALRASLDPCVKHTIYETQCPVIHITDLFTDPKYSGPQAECFRKDGQAVDKSIDYCSLCGACSFVCPQGVKVTEIIHHCRTIMKEAHGIPPRDRLIGRAPPIDIMMTPVASITSWVLDVKPIHLAMEAIIGVHRSAPMPRAYGHTFESWFKKHEPLANSGTRGQIIFSHGCTGRYFEVETSIHSVMVLGHLGYEVLVPRRGCYGLTLQSNGLYDDMCKYVSKLTSNLRSVSRDTPIISTSDSCDGMLRHGAHGTLKMGAPELKDAGSHTWDINKFLLRLYDKDELDTNFQRIDVTILYHAPRQVKSQGLDKPVIGLMNLIPSVTVKDSEQPCCGIAGTYDMKGEKYAIAQTVGAPVFNFIKQVNAELVACNAGTYRWQLRTTTGANVVHPIQLAHRIYGLPSG